MAIISALIKKVFDENKEKFAFNVPEESEKLTFAEYAVCCAKINGLLKSKGLSKGDCIAVLLGRNKEYLIAQTAGLLYGYKLVLLDQGSLAEAVIRSVYMPEHMGNDIAALIAPFTFIAGDSVTEQMLSDEIKKKLPSYMLPNSFVKLDVLPVNANGKLDRNALKDPKNL
ncbi:AMP-binding protein [Treponema sp.]|uniref:AMP-binding protein n=1 Tax=Treponema sp. TaxID=166 RepID=UPI00298D6F33|nr:AMP-binding protein [Treponema sp.]MCQ2241614.1 AMP-binding protein [Treponema sp.]